MPAVRVENLSHTYPARRRQPARAALQNVSFEVPVGAFFGLLGPNGGGKSTAFQILATLFPPSGGSASLFDIDIVERPESVRRDLGVVFQNPSLDKKLTVHENLWHQGHLYGLSGATLAQRIDAQLARFGLSGRRNDLVETLSGGLRRRVEIAKALLPAPRLLLLDEPTTGLDPAVRRELWDALAGMRRETGLTVLVTTHLMEEAERCDQVVILNEGRIVAAGAPDALKSEVGGDVITIDTPVPETLQRKISERFSVAVQIVDGALRLERAQGHVFIPTLIEALPGDIQGIRLSKPTLEDVFIRKNGPPLMMLATFTLWQREMVRFFRQPSRVIGAVVPPILFWFLIGSGLGDSFRAGSGEATYLQYFFPGTILLIILFTAIFSTISIIEDRHEGFLQAVLVAPGARTSLVLGKILGGASLAFIQALAFWLFAPLLGFSLSVAGWFEAVGMLFLLACGLTGLGFCLAWKLDSTQGFHAIMNLFLIPLWLLSGALFPAAGAAAWIQWIIRLNPLSYGLTVLQRTLTLPGAALETSGPGWLPWLAVALFTALMLGLSLALVRKR